MRSFLSLHRLLALACACLWGAFHFTGVAATPGDRWEERSRGLSKRASHSAVWTGREAIFWGGGSQSQFLGDGARYDPATDQWHPISNVDAPSGRWFHAAIWTGHEMIVWGGRANFDSSEVKDDGARYDPATDTWRPISTLGAPSRRSQMAAVWTGTEMIVWGGAGDEFASLSDGGSYNPATDTWRPLPSSGLEGRVEPAAVWTGEEMIVWGGVAIGFEWQSWNTGARYNPSTDVWTPLPTLGAPRPASGHTLVWTGGEMIVWGGLDYPSRTWLNEGKRFSVADNVWRPISSMNAPDGRAYHCAVWTGIEMIVWGGIVDGDLIVNTGGRYNLMRDEWTPTSLLNAPPQRHFWRPDLGIWTGKGMIVWGGSDYPEELDSNFYYLPSPVSGTCGNAGDCLTNLIALSASVTNRQDQDRVSDAVQHLTKALDCARWVDPTHLQRKGGEKSFEEGKQAVHALVKLLKDPRSTVPEAAVRAVIDCILQADRLLAVIALQEAEASGLKPKKVAEDRREIEKGDREAADGEYEQAIDRYRNAWSHVVHLRINLTQHVAHAGARLQFVGAENETYVIEVSSDLAHWTPLGSARANAEGEVILDDPASSEYATRFYRIASP